MCGLGSQRRPLRSPPQPLWDGLRMLGLGHHEGPLCHLAAGACPGSRGQPVEAGWWGSWGLGCLELRLKEATGHEVTLAGQPLCAPQSCPVGPPSRQGSGRQQGGRPGHARAVLSGLCLGAGEGPVPCALLGVGLQGRRPALGCLWQQRAEPCCVMAAGSTPGRAWPWPGPAASKTS